MKQTEVEEKRKPTVSSGKMQEANWNAFKAKFNPRVQHPLTELHFDIRNNRVISYNPAGNLEEVKRAFWAAAEHL